MADGRWKIEDGRFLDISGGVLSLRSLRSLRLNPWTLYFSLQLLAFAFLSPQPRAIHPQYSSHCPTLC